MNLTDIRVGDVVQMRKRHPCGSDQWTVTRVGADIKIACSGCGRMVMMDRETFVKRRRRVVTPGTGAGTPAAFGAEREISES